jgi:hypothetical protein
MPRGQPEGHRKKGARKAPKRKPSKKAKPKAQAAGPRVADLGALDYKRLKLGEVREDISAARAAGRHTALCQLHRLEVQLHDEIEEALLAQGDDAAALSSEQLMGFILETLLELPQGVQDQVSATLAAVRDGSIVKLGDAPKQATKKRRTAKR